MKHINDFTIKEFEEFSNLMSEKIPDIFSIFKLFGEDASKMKFDTFEKKWFEIQNMRLSTKGTKKIYKIGNRKFKAVLNPYHIKAGQFVDFQSYVKNGLKLNEILSVFLLPMEKKLFGYKTHKYNEGYDIFEVQKYIYENMLISEANELSTFFLTWSSKQLTLMNQFLLKKRVKEMKKRNQ